VKRRPSAVRIARAPAAALFAAACAVAACGPAPVDLGPSPEILWWSDHETGDFSDWLQGGDGFVWSAEGGHIEVAAGIARSGTHAIRAGVVSPTAGMQSAGIAMRTGGTPARAYYSAWYYVPAAATDTTYWLFFKFRSRRTATDSTTIVDVWDLDFLPAGGGTMRLSLYHHGSGAIAAGVIAPIAPAEIPIGRWFQIETLLSAAADETGQLTVWQDGMKVYDIAGKATMPSAYVEWSVGGITEMIDPGGATLYVDDAAISTERLGPSFPIFWRSE
jgi:hypothetical protein